MKKKLVLTILGIAATATAFGQGGIVFDNGPADSLGVYHPVVWAGIGSGVHSTDGVQLSFWYGKGAGLTADQLTAGPAAQWNTVLEGAGYYGYYNQTTVFLPTWVSGDTFTFQIRASGNSVYGSVDTALSRSALWEESANINFVNWDYTWLPGYSNNRIGLSVSVVPEPSSIALLGLGVAALVTLRRRS